MKDEEQPEAEAAQETTVPSGGRTASEFRDIADALRNRVDLFGKTLAAVATLGTTAVGLSKIGDLFPAEGNELWVVAACIGLAVAALAAIGVAVRLMSVARPIFMDDDLDANPDLDKDERAAAGLVFGAAARRFGYTSVTSLRRRERSLRDAASRALDKEERVRRTALADEVKAEIEQAFARGQLVVIRRRSTRAVTARAAWFLYFAVIGGLIVFAVGADKVSSDRRDPTADAKACGEARKAGATAEELGRTDGVCDGAAAEADGDPNPPSAAEARAQVIAKVASVLEACTALAHNGGDATSRPLSDTDCNALRQALSAMSKTSP